MTNEIRSFLNTLEIMLDEQGKNAIYPCIRDLTEQCLDLALFSSAEIPPNLQDITHYLAAWSRHTGLSEEESRDWLIDYCITMGSSLTTKTPAAIRHSTKSILKYVYRSSVPFLCQCANNRFHAQCSSECPVYDDMQTNLRVKADELSHPRQVSRAQATLIEPTLSLKEVYREQFNTALGIILDEGQKGTNIKDILAILNERGLKTRTGRKWQDAILRHELKNLNTAANASSEAC